MKKMLAVKKLMLESILNCRFRGTTMSYSELLVALENIIIDQISTVRTVRNRKIDTSAPMELGMTAKDDGSRVREDGNIRIVDLALQAVYTGTGKAKWSFGKGQSWDERRIPRWQSWERWRKNPCDKCSDKKMEATGKRKVAREKPEHVGRVARQATLHRVVEKETTTICTALTKMTVKTLKKEATDHEGDLQVCWLL